MIQYNNKTATVDTVNHAKTK